LGVKYRWNNTHLERMNDMHYKIFDFDPSLRAFESDFDLRMENFYRKKAELLQEGQTLADFANGHKFFGFHRVEVCWVYREWAPAADAVYLAGDFNGWDRRSHPLRKGENGVFEIFLPGEDALWDGCRVMAVVLSGGRELERIPLYAHRVIQDPQTFVWNAVIHTEKPSAGRISASRPRRICSFMNATSVWPRKRARLVPMRSSG